MKWSTRPLAEVADFCLGKMLDDKKNRGEPLPYLANINVRWGEFDLENLREMRFEHDEMDRYGLKYGDIVLCEGGEPGRCAIWKDLLPGMMFQKALHRIRAHDCIDHRFLFYSFLQKGKTGSFSPLLTGATIKHLPREKLAKVEIAFPRLEVQRRIADILAAYDNLIENNRRRIALLEEAARQLYCEWFVRLRFPGHEHTRITNGVPEGWKKRRLSEVAEVNKESLPSSYEGEIHYIDISSVTPGSINKTTRYDFRDAPSRARRVLKRGDILWSCVRPNRRSHAVIWQPTPTLIVSTGFAVLTPTVVPTAFLLQATTTDSFVGYLDNHARGAAYPAVVAGDFERAEVLVPRATLVDAFNEQAEPLLEQGSTLQTQNEKLRAARDLLLPRLMTGQLSV